LRCFDVSPNTPLAILCTLFSLPWIITCVASSFAAAVLAQIATPVLWTPPEAVVAHQHVEVQFIAIIRLRSKGVDSISRVHRALECSHQHVGRTKGRRQPPCVPV